MNFLTGHGIGSYKEKFLRGFERKIILSEAAASEIKRAGLTKLPSVEKLEEGLDGLSARKSALQAELRKVRQEEKECDALRRNVDILLLESLKVGMKSRKWNRSNIMGKIKFTYAGLSTRMAINLIALLFWLTFN